MTTLPRGSGTESDPKPSPGDEYRDHPAPWERDRERSHALAVSIVTPCSVEAEQGAISLLPHRGSGAGGNAASPRVMRDGRGALERHTARYAARRLPGLTRGTYFQPGWRAGVRADRSQERSTGLAGGLPKGARLGPLRTLRAVIERSVRHWQLREAGTSRG